MFGGKLMDLTGQTFGSLTVIARNPISGPQRQPRWDCRCACGTETTVYSQSLRMGKTTSCGCARNPAALIGATFGMLTVRARDWDRRGRWHCDCACGGALSALASSLRRGASWHCGCQHGWATRTHGQASNKHGVSPTYHVWRSMLERCRKHKDYAGRGITVCERWMRSFANFLADMGEKPVGLSLDRRNNDLGYSPENCRWATPKEQAQNRRTSRLEPHEPDQICWLRSLGYRNCDVARFFGISPQHVSNTVARSA